MAAQDKLEVIVLSRSVGGLQDNRVSVDSVKESEDALSEVEFSEVLVDAFLFNKSQY